MLRLTLRTLLAYLDDTLQPAQAKDIGKKVAESDFAKETVDRIKTVTRRRRLTAPPVLADDHSTDPNAIAEYLDNVLPADQVTDLEESALANDTRLAEVAACHQILTLVLGEPARIPPMARRRMYRLVTGPESLPYRQPTMTTPVAGIAAPDVVDEYQDEDDLLTTFLGPQKLLWLLCILLAIGLLILAVWLAVPARPPEPNQGFVAATPPRGDVSPKPGPISKKTDNGDKKPSVPSPVEPPHTDQGPAPRELGAGPIAPKEADTERRAVGAWDSPDQPLLFQKRDTGVWAKVEEKEPQVSSQDTLVALPGFHPEIKLDSGLRLHLWGNVPEILALPLSEARASLAVPAAGFDGDLTLYSGRALLSTPKAARPMIVRVRFRSEIWDVTIAPDSQVGIDLIGEPARSSLFNRELLETPRAALYVAVLQGFASVQMGPFQKTGDLAAGAKWKWDSKAGRPAPAPKDDPDDTLADRWTKQIPATPAGKEAAATVAEMARRVTASGGPFELEFNSTLKEKSEPAGRRALATWMLASLDSLPYLTDALETEDSSAVRDAAAKALRHWVAQEPKRDALFQQELATKVTYTENHRMNVSGLIYALERPLPTASVDQLFELLGNEKLAVRELARLQLATLDPQGFKESNYDAMSDRRGGQIALWKIKWKQKMK